MCPPMTSLASSARALLSNGGQDADANRTTLRKILESDARIPASVRNASFSRCQERVLEEHELHELLAQEPPKGAAEDWLGRLQRRSEALTPFIGHRLCCVFIQLPGTHFTAEISAIAGKLVYWEFESNRSTTPSGN